MSSPRSVEALLDLEAIRKRIGLAQRIFGVSFDGYPDTERSPEDIQRDRDRAALFREVERLREALSPPTPQWQPIETLPEGQRAILWCNYLDDAGAGCCVDSFKWREESYDELVSETETRRVYEKRVRRDREWSRDGWSATHWMPLPPSPQEQP